MRARRASPLVLALLAATSLGACATQGGPAPTVAAGLRGPMPASSGPNPAPDLASDLPGLGGESRSVFGLYLAAQAAIDAGSSREAAAYLAQASAAAPDQTHLRDRAFTTTLLSGEVSRAASMAPAQGDSPQALQGLGLLTRATEALAEGRAKTAAALLAEPGIQPPHALAASLLRPWALALSGDTVAALTPQPAGSDRVAAAFLTLSRAQLLERLGKPAEAEALLKPLAEGAGGVFALAYGGYLERRGRGEEALKLYEARLAKNAADGAFLAARARVQAHRPPPALPSLKQGAAQALIAPAALMLATREGDHGLAYLRLALRIDPAMDEAWILVGEAMMAAGDRDAGRDAFEHVRPASSEYATAQTRLAMSLSAAGDKDGAMAAAETAFRAAPETPEAVLVYAELLRAAERYDEAAAAVQRLIPAYGATPLGWRLYYVKGACEERAGRWAEGEADLKRAVELKGDDPELLNYLGYAWADRGEHLKEAEAMLTKAAALQPESGAIADSLGWVRFRLGERREALRLLERAAGLSPADPDVNEHLGDAYWSVGRQLEAAYQWRRVLTLDPGKRTRERVQVKLASANASVAAHAAAAAP